MSIQRRLMKRVFKAVIFCGMFFAITSAVFAVEYPWELKKVEDGIRVHVRKVEGSAILEYKGTVTVKAGVEEAVRLFEDDARTPEWFYECLESRTLRTETPSSEIIYFAIHMPWPVKDRDAVFRRVRTNDLATGAVRYETSALPQDYPEQKGKIRMPIMKGRWSFTPLAGGGTEVTYQEHSEVGGHIPAWLVNKLAVNIPFNSLARFRELLAKTSSS